MGVLKDETHPPAVCAELLSSQLAHPSAAKPDFAGVGGYQPLNQRRRVDFPEPLVPKTASVSPTLTSKLTRPAPPSPPNRPSVNRWTPNMMSTSFRQQEGPAGLAPPALSKAGTKPVESVLTPQLSPLPGVTSQYKIPGRPAGDDDFLIRSGSAIAEAERRRNGARLDPAEALRRRTRAERPSPPQGTSSGTRISSVPEPARPWPPKVTAPKRPPQSATSAASCRLSPLTSAYRRRS